MIKKLGQSHVAAAWEQVSGEMRRERTLRRQSSSVLAMGV